MRKSTNRARIFALASVFLVVHFSSTHVLASTRSSSSWSAPLRIGVQSSLLGRKKRLTALVATTSTESSTNRREEEETHAPPPPSQEESLFDEAEWNALFESEGDEYSQASYPARRSPSLPSLSRNAFDENRGFRHALKLPAFLTRPKQSEELLRYEDYEVLPCAAISVSSKVSGQQASFSSGMQGRQSTTTRTKPREPTLNRRREASKPQPQQQSATASPTLTPTGRPLVFWENMVCGAISRSVAQTVMHPANTMKTLLQQSNAAPLTSYLKPSAMPVLFRGAGANFVLSVPHGAINFAVLELVRKELSRVVKASKYSEEKIGPALDFLSSAISTICCSVVSTPQMMITDNIMAGNYPNLPSAIRGLGSDGIQGFYKRGWWPGLVGKIPSYALTWTIFQQLKVAQKKLSGREATNLENSIMGCLASGTTVTIMIPLDTVKTRLVTQATKPGVVPYKGIIDCAVRISKEEGVKAFYRGLPPRLVSVVPMIGIQFTVYEFMKRVMQKRALAEQRMAIPAADLQPKPILSKLQLRNKRGEEDANFDSYSSFEQLQESCMEVAASPEHPYPAPHFLRVMRRKDKRGHKRNS